MPPCRYEWNCWRPGCAFAHDQARERHEHVRDLAEFWAKAARPLGIAKHSTTTESEIALSSGVAGSSGPREEDTTSASNTTVAKAVGNDRLPETAKRSVSTASEFAVSSGEVGPLRLKANGRNSAGITTVAMPAGEARPPEIAKRSATTKSELAESPDGNSSSD